MNPAEIAVFAGMLEQLSSEMDLTLERSAFSPIISEATDRACGIYSATDGGVIAQGHRGLPIFVGIMQSSVQAFLRDVPTYTDGDVFIMNDPFRGGTHLMDVRVLAPYYHRGELVCFLATTAHWADIGGATPGGFGPSARSIYEEGLLIPPTRIVRDGELDRNVLGVILANIRLAPDREGDLLAQLNALEVGRRRLDEVIDRYGLADFHRLSGELADYSERLTRAVISRLPDGEYEARDFLDDDGIGFDALEIRCRLTVRGDEMTLDFTGTSRPCAGPVNSPVGASTSAVFIALMHMFPDLPINRGTFRPVRVHIPDGTFLAATHPSPVSGCASEVPSRVIDVVLAAIGTADPTLAQGGSASTSVNFTLHGQYADREYIMYFFAGGGYGAYEGSDGLSNACSSISMAKVPPIELLEEWYPIRFEQYRLRDGSGGDGEYRGGLGAEYVVRVNSDYATASFLGDRGKFPPLGIAGGAHGATTTIHILRADGTDYTPPHVSKDHDIELRAGDRIWVRMPGGAGYGDAARRSREAREHDARSGYVEGAAEVHA